MQSRFPDLLSVVLCATGPWVNFICKTVIILGYSDNDGMYISLSRRSGAEYTPPWKLESKNFGARTSVIHHWKRIANGFPGMCDFKSVHGAPGEIFHFEGFQILKLGLFFEGF